MAFGNLVRRDANCLELLRSDKIPVTVFANEQVPIEPVAVAELQSMLEVQATATAMYQACPDQFHAEPHLQKVAVTPDFHKASGIPVGTVLQTEGFVIPQAIGNDINCGMRLHLTDLSVDKVESHADSLETTFREMYFEAGRRIPMQWQHRESLLLDGIRGLFDTVDPRFDGGLWSYFHRTDRQQTLARIDRAGSLPAAKIVGLESYLGEPDRVHRDSQIGSIGGGNHFVEIQRVERIIEPQIAHAWGLRPGQVTVMVHTGSVSIGYASGSHYRSQLRTHYPSSLPHPANEIYVLPLASPQEGVFWDAMHNAANFAFANRMFLGLMAWASLEKVLGEITFPLLYDAPHNMIWPEQRDGRTVYVHRKGACPARGFEQMEATPFAYYGEPVLVPGSMGASSYVLAGNGLENAIHSAAHGAGRQISRGASMKKYDREFDEFMKAFRVVTPVDFRRQEIARRRDIVAKKLADLRQEAPFAYKGIGPVIETIESGGLARPVAELRPIMTIKG
ncbi:RtcB family protein [Bremerella sp. JC817]|uniref:RtcB family protein n=1 Tax=Bremerella sp. JC817 TaxID=3231756 RepID=UPI00345AD986